MSSNLTPSASDFAASAEKAAGAGQNSMHAPHKKLLIRVGTAGWSLPSAAQPAFPAHGTHLQRYAARLPAVEINTSFYRSHRPDTYAKWAAGVPSTFRFSVKVPKIITHEHRLVGTSRLFASFMSEVSMLGEALGCLLVQLPPSLEFESRTASRFFAQLRKRYDGPAVLEPRHPSWFCSKAEQLLRTQWIGRVAADPAPVAAAAEPGGFSKVVYYRLHGTPRRYYSPYSQAFLDALIGRLAAFATSGSQVWCIFDNTASGAAVPNALYVSAAIVGSRASATVRASDS